jgi:hypothetical protein
MIIIRSNRFNRSREIPICPHTLAMRMVFCDNESYAKTLLGEMKERFPAKYADAQVVPVSIELKEVSKEEAEEWQADDNKRFRN